MKKIIINIVISLIITICVIFMYHTIFRKEMKLAYIKTGVLLNDYKGMLIANEQFNKDLQAVQANIDTLKSRYEQLKMKESKITPDEKTDWAKQLAIAEYEYNNYLTTAQQQLEERKNTLRAEVVNKINLFIQDYGKEHNYIIIFGATDQGSILYGHEQKDLTEIILKELNEDYSKESK